MRENIRFPTFSIPVSGQIQPVYQQLQTTQTNMTPFLEINTQERVQAEEQHVQAMPEGETPEMLETMTGTNQSAQLQCQLSQDELRVLIKAAVEDVVMNQAIPLVLDAMHLQFDQLLAFISDKLVQQPLPILGHIQSLRSLLPDVGSSESRSLTLHFVSQLPCDGLYTFTSIIDYEGDSIKVELQDSLGSRIEDGPESSAKIRLHVLCGEFNVEDKDDWTEHDFNNNVAKSRENRGPLLKGKCEIYMSKGVACFDDIAFTDNSKARIDGKFRLGARVVKGLPPGLVVKDAVSEAFRVRERRMKSSIKRTMICLEDRTDCLKHIGENLSQKLSETTQVHTVKDFLQLYNTDADKLRKEALPIRGKRWSELVNSALSCSLTDDGYWYYDEQSNFAPLLNCVFDIVGVVCEGRAFQLYTDLDDSLKEFSIKMRHNAYKKQEELQKIDLKSCLASQQALSLSTASIPHTRAQNIEEDTMKMLNEHNAIGEKHGGCSQRANQAAQGKQVPLSSAVDTAEIEKWVASLLGPSTKDRTQASCSQYQNFNPLPSDSSFREDEDWMPDQFRMTPVNNSQSVVLNTRQRSVAFSGLKRSKHV